MDEIKVGLHNWMPMDVSAHGAKIDSLIAVIHWFMALLFIGWGAFFIYCLFKFRTRPGHVATYAPIKGIFTKYIEVAVVVVEVFLLFGLSTPVWLAYKNQAPDEKNALRVHVAAQQFAWNFHYAGKDKVMGETGAQWLSDNPVGLNMESKGANDDVVSVNVFHFPVNTDIILDITSRDVIHSFNIPTMRVKQDAIPGQSIPIWFKGVETGHYEIACAQLCGVGHTTMRGDVFIDTPEQFAKWQAENQQVPEEAPAEAPPTAAQPKEQK